MNDTASIRVILISSLTASELIVGDDVYRVEELWRPEDGLKSTMIWERNNKQLHLVPDGAHKDWLVNAIENYGSMAP